MANQQVGPQESEGSKGSAALRPELQTLLGETVTFLLAAGLSNAVLARELRRAALRIEKGRQPVAQSTTRQIRELREQLVEIAGVVHDWTRESASTDGAGEPICLSRRQLRELIRRRFDGTQVPAVLEWMKENGMVRRTKRGAFVLTTGRQVVLSSKGRRRLVMARAATLVPQYLRVAFRNAGTTNPDVRDIDRDARVYFLPEKYVPLWREVVRARAQAFLESIDNWLEDHARHAHVGRVREVGLHCYSYTGESRLPKSGAGRETTAKPGRVRRYSPRRAKEGEGRVTS